MLDYLFFNIQFAELFIKFLDKKRLKYTQAKELVQNANIVCISENLDDDLWNEIDNVYDDLAEQDQQMLQDELEDDNKIDTAGIYIQLANDKTTIAKIDPDVMNRMLETISMDEFNDFIEVIVASVENPDNSALCEKI